MNIVMCFRCFRSFLDSGIERGIGWFVCFGCLQKGHISSGKVETPSHTQEMPTVAKAAV